MGDQIIDAPMARSLHADALRTLGALNIERRRLLLDPAAHRVEALVEAEPLGEHDVEGLDGPLAVGLRERRRDGGGRPGDRRGQVDRDDGCERHAQVL